MKPRRFPFMPAFDESPISYSSPHRHEWVESSADIEPGRHSHEYLGTSIDEWRLRTLLFGIIGILGLFFIRTAYLQIFEGQGFALLADRNKVKIQILPARRGIIYDRNKTILTHNIPDFGVHVIPSELPKDQLQRTKEIAELSAIVKMSEGDIEHAIQAAHPYQGGIIVEHVPYIDALKIEVAIAQMPGVSLYQSYVRKYDTKDVQSISHVLGYTGRISEKELSERGEEYNLNDTLGKEGIELTYEADLRGLYGQRQIEVDALGTEKGIIAEDQAQDGKNIILSIDAELQKKTEEVMRHWMEGGQKKRGTVIITKPQTGEVLTLVSLPAYDNNAFAKGISSSTYAELLRDPDHPLFNRAVYGEYPSGSTIKPVVASAGLQEGVITETSVVRSTGGIWVGKWYFPDWKAGGHGVTNVVKALAESVNTFFYAVGGGYADIAGLGPDRLVSYFRKFGLGERTGIDVANERNGFIPSPEWKQKTKNEQWFIGDTYHIAIGQGDVLVTPLQVNQFTCYFANGGSSYRPHVVKSTIDNSGKEIPIESVVYKKNIIDTKNVDIVRAGMRQTVLAGSARRLSTLPVSAAGKTGTAQWHPDKEPHAWFTGWAPYEDPQVAITVLVEEGVEGSRIATPIATDILQWYFKDRFAPKQEDQLTKK